MIFNLSYSAMMFAREVHADQKRKYTGNPYTDHLAEVAGIAATVGYSDISIELDQVIAVCWLHDCMEDQSVSRKELLGRFGEQVTHGVHLLSDMEPGNRAQRKAITRDRLAAAPGWVQTIKCADLISNTSSIVQHDPDFAKVYLEEKRALLEVLTKADSRLLRLASGLCLA